MRWQWVAVLSLSICLALITVLVLRPTRSLELRDGDGVLRLSAGITPTGDVQFQMLNEVGVVRLFAKVPSEGSPELGINDHRGDIRLSFDLTPKGAPFLTMKDTNGVDRVSLQVSDGGEAGIVLFNYSPNPPMTGTRTVARIGLLEGHANGAVMFIDNSDGKREVTIGEGQQGRSGREALSVGGSSHIELRSSPEEGGIIVLREPSGSERWRSPMR